MAILKKLCTDITIAKQTRKIPGRLLYIHGNRLINRGCVFTLTMQDLNKMFLIIIDSYSKWLEIVPTTADSADTIKKLRTVFANHGLPEQCVSDNGSPFTSEEFETFLQKNGVEHIRTSPYHPSSNGMAERMVQTFKNTLQKMSAEKRRQKSSKKLFSRIASRHKLPRGNHLQSC